MTLIRRAATVVTAAMVAVVLAAMAVELWVRMSWDDQRGRPGFYLSDPVLGQRLSPGYYGWFAGVPVRINTLGFRDQRDYAIEKPAGTFRILALRDSVTFGHGTRSETTYPFLLEQRLRAWKPNVEWQVWNLGVPGYATSQELAYLDRVGPLYQPDLVIVGFYANDLTGNVAQRPPTLIRRTQSAAQSVIQRWLYSYEFYKRAALVAQWRRAAGGTQGGTHPGEQCSPLHERLPRSRSLKSRSTGLCKSFYRSTLAARENLAADLDGAD